MTPPNHCAFLWHFIEYFCGILLSILLKIVKVMQDMERMIVYTPRGKCSVYYASRVSVFLEKSFRVQKKRLRLIVRAHWAR